MSLEIFKHDGREYIELPKTKDGEYIHVGRYYYGGDGREWEILGYRTDNAPYTVFAKSSSGYDWNGLKPEWLSPTNPLQPEVLDADGVPIKVGDVVYHVSDGEEYHVKGLSDGVYITVASESGICGVRPERVSHIEPDTQEKIDADALLEPKEYIERYTDFKIEELDLCEIVGLIVEHLLNRQRELDKRLMGGE